MDIDKALGSIESMRKYWEELPEVDNDDLYCIVLSGEDMEDEHYYLLMVMNDDQAYESLDASFMYTHNVESREKVTRMTLLRPANEYGERNEMANMEVNNG